MPANAARIVMNQDEKETSEGVKELGGRDEGPGLGNQRATEGSQLLQPQFLQPQSSSPSSSTGLQWLVRTGVQAAAVVIVAGLVFFLMGIAQRTGWLTTDGFSGGRAERATGSRRRRRQTIHLSDDVHAAVDAAGRCPVCAMELVEATGGGGGDGISVHDRIIRASTGRYSNRHLQNGRGQVEPSARSARSTSTKADCPRSVRTSTVAWRRCTPITPACG